MRAIALARGLAPRLFAWGEGERWDFVPSPENSHSRAVLCLRQTRSLRFSISAMLNPAQRAHGFNPPKEPEVPVPPVLTAARSGEKIRWFSEKFFDKLSLLAYNRINGFVDYAVIRKWRMKGTQFPSGVWGSAPASPPSSPTRTLFTPKYCAIDSFVHICASS